METIDYNSKERPYSIFTICKGYDLTRDAFYKYNKRYVKRIKLKTRYWKSFIKEEGLYQEKVLEN
jgi:putative transposase